MTITVLYEVNKEIGRLTTSAKTIGKDLRTLPADVQLEIMRRFHATRHNTQEFSVSDFNVVLCGVK